MRDRARVAGALAGNATALDSDAQILVAEPHQRTRTAEARLRRDVGSEYVDRPVAGFCVAGIVGQLTDGGPALRWQTRVGRWGKEFRFPKFRSMRLDAERLLDSLLAENQHQGGVTFKMRRDPRVTPVVPSCVVPASMNCRKSGVC